MKKIALTTTIIVFLFTVAITSVNAQYQSGKSAIGTVTLPAGVDQSPDAVSNYIPTIVSVAFLIGLIASLAYTVYGGIKWITSGGDPKALAAAKDTIVQAIIGLILLSTAFAIGQLFNNLFKPAAPAPLSPYYGVGIYCNGTPQYSCKQNFHACVSNVCECADPLKCNRGPR